MTVYDNSLIYWVWLTIAFGPANHRKWELGRNFDEVKDFYDAIQSGYSKGFTKQELQSARAATLKQAEGILSYCEKHHIYVYGCDSPDYPMMLKDIYDPPSVLFSMGDLSFVNHSPTLGVVGARNMTKYTEKVTECICENIVKNGMVIISGFAKGVDSAAHTAALRGGGKTVAVLGNGVEYEYPPDSHDLKVQISRGGAVISEYFPQTKPTPISFKARNRILSGMSSAVLVTQASKASGSLNTASHAISQGRDLFCVPPADVFSDDYAGTAMLIRDGAIPVFSHTDILYEYYSEFAHKLRFTKDTDVYWDKSSSSVFFAADRPVSKKNTSKKKAAADTPKKEEAAEAHTEKADIDMSSLGMLQQKIVAELERSQMAADELADKLQTDISQILTELTSLEMDGLVVSLAGRRFRLA